MQCEWANFVALFNTKTEQTLAENILSSSHTEEHRQLQSHCLGHQLGKVITSRNSIICVPVGPYDHCKASLSASPIPYFMSVHSFIQLILIGLPQGNWQRDNASYWMSRREDPVTHLTPSVCFSGGILKKDIACDIFSLMMKLTVLEGLLSQDWLLGFSIQWFISTLASSWWEDRLHHNTMECWLHRSLHTPGNGPQPDW